MIRRTARNPCWNFLAVRKHRSCLHPPTVLAGVFEQARVQWLQAFRLSEERFLLIGAGPNHKCSSLLQPMGRRMRPWGFRTWRLAHETTLPAKETFAQTLFGVRRSAPLWTEGRAGEIKAAVTAALQGLRGESTGSGGQSAEGRSAPRRPLPSLKICKWPASEKPSDCDEPRRRLFLAAGDVLARNRPLLRSTMSALPNI
jgi:hypothetical protein